MRRSIGVNGSPFDLIVLDGALCGLDGIALCRAIRLGDINAGTAVLVVAASGAESDKIAAFTNGADDLTKPVGDPRVPGARRRRDAKGLAEYRSTSAGRGRACGSARRSIAAAG